MFNSRVFVVESAILLAPVADLVGVDAADELSAVDVTVTSIILQRSGTTVVNAGVFDGVVSAGGVFAVVDVFAVDNFIALHVFAVGTCAVDNLLAVNVFAEDFAVDNLFAVNITPVDNLFSGNVFAVRIVNVDVLFTVDAFAFDVFASIS